MPSWGSTMPDVILPALDEASAIGWVLERMPVGYRAIVVDNGSIDATASIAQAAGAVVVSEPVRGFGSTCSVLGTARRNSHALAAGPLLRIGSGGVNRNLMKRGGKPLPGGAAALLDTCSLSASQICNKFFVGCVPCDGR